MIIRQENTPLLLKVITNWKFLFNFSNEVVLVISVIFLTASSVHAKENRFYLKANIGCNNPIKQQLHGRGAFAKSPVLKSKYDINLGIGAGYYVIDNLRVDLVFSKVVNPTIQGNRLANTISKDNYGKKFRSYFNTKVKASVQTFMFNGYYDIYNTGALKLFIGAGVGLGQISGKIFTRNTFKDIEGKADIKIKAGIFDQITDYEDTSIKIKENNTLAFAAHLGISYDFNSHTSGELTYSYKSMGKTRMINLYKSNLDFRGHHITVGIRLNI